MELNVGAAGTAPPHEDIVCSLCRMSMKSPVMVPCCDTTQCLQCVHQRFATVDAERWGLVDEIPCWGCDLATVRLGDLIEIPQWEGRFPPKSVKRRLCLICHATSHSTARCPTIVCKRCSRSGHAAISCILDAPTDGLELAREMLAKVKSESCPVETCEVVEAKEHVLLSLPNASLTGDRKVCVGKVHWFNQCSRRGMIIQGRKRYSFQGEEDHDDFAKNQYVIFEKCEKRVVGSVRAANLRSRSGQVTKKLRAKKNVRRVKVRCADTAEDVKMSLWIRGANVDIGDTVSFTEVMDDVDDMVLLREIHSLDSTATSSIIFVEAQIFRFKGHEQLSQLGAVVIKGRTAETFFRPIRISKKAGFSDLFLLEQSWRSSDEGVVFDHPKLGLLPCFWEGDALKSFLEVCKKEKKNFADRPLLIYFSRAKEVLPFLLQQLRKYDLQRDFQSIGVSICDLQTVLGLSKEWKHLQSFCWNRVRFVFHEVVDHSMPAGSLSADIVAKAIWLLTEKLFDGEDLNQSQRFQKLFMAINLGPYVSLNSLNNSIQSSNNMVCLS